MQNKLENKLVQNWQNTQKVNKSQINNLLFNVIKFKVNLKVSNG